MRAVAKNGLLIRAGDTVAYAGHRPREVRVGLVLGVVGTGRNMLRYATELTIRDGDTGNLSERYPHEVVRIP